MNWLTCTVELYSRRKEGIVSGEFEGRSLYEACWLALCTWCQDWSNDSQAILTVRQGKRVWRVDQGRIREWRPVVRADEARRQVAAAKATVERTEQPALFDTRPEPF